MDVFDEAIMKVFRYRRLMGFQRILARVEGERRLEGLSRPVFAAQESHRRVSKILSYRAPM